MTDETKLKIVEALAKSGMSVGQFIMENTGIIKYTDNRGNTSAPKEKDKKEVNPEQFAKALLAVQTYMWGYSSNAVIFCALRDNHKYKGTMSDYERQCMTVEETNKLSWPCPEGTIRSAFFNNPFLKLSVDKWKDQGVQDRVMILLEKFEEQIELQFNK